MKNAIKILCVLLFLSASLLYFGNMFMENSLGFLDVDGTGCDVTQKGRNFYCHTDNLDIYGTNVFFPKEVTIKIHWKKKKLHVENLSRKNLNIIKDTIYTKRIKELEQVQDKSKQELSKLILEKFYKKNGVTSDEIAENIMQITLVNDYILRSKEVKILSENESGIVPTDIIKLKNKNVKYIVLYDYGTSNYYNDEGILVMRKYELNNKPYRYQTYDKHNNFYTYDSDLNLVEYSKRLKVYDLNGNLIYEADPTDTTRMTKMVGYSKRSQEEKLRIPKNYEKVEAWKTLNNANSEEYKSIVAVIDEHYENGSAKEMVSALQEYFDNQQSKKSPVYKFYMSLLQYNDINMNFGKGNKKYMFSLSGSYYMDNNALIATMADLVNIFWGNCSETNLKNMTKDELAGRYFYDLKLKRQKSRIVVSEHFPCSTCIENISLWGWKYPSSK